VQSPRATAPQVAGTDSIDRATKKPGGPTDRTPTGAAKAGSGLKQGDVGPLKSLYGVVNVPRGRMVPELTDKEVRRALPNAEPSGRALARDIVRIRRQVLPRVREAIRVFRNNTRTIDSRVCNQAAAMARVALINAGYPPEDVKLTYNLKHAFVTVQTEHGELLVDPTMSQFFANDTRVDDTLQKGGGFVGTRGDLCRFVARYHAALENPQPGMGYHDYPPEARADPRALTLWAQDVLSGHLSNWEPTMERSALADQAEQIVSDYERWVARGRPDAYEPERRSAAPSDSYPETYRILEGNP
jgi:hypothetical protein